jgi:hypothetical protein
VSIVAPTLADLSKMQRAVQGTHHGLSVMIVLGVPNAVHPDVEEEDSNVTQQSLPEIVDW